MYHSTLGWIEIKKKMMNLLAKPIVRDRVHHQVLLLVDLLIDLVFRVLRVWVLGFWV